MNAPNALTIARLLLTPLAVTLLFLPLLPGNTLLALMVFFAATLTDVADGFIARRWDLQTKFGAFLDPLADKLLFLLLFTVLQNRGLYPLWLLLLFLARELLVDGFRAFAAHQNIYLGAVFLGKLKAFLQTLSLYLGLLALAMREGELPLPFLIPLFQSGAYWIMSLALSVSLVGAPFLLHLHLSLFQEEVPRKH